MNVFFSAATLLFSVLAPDYIFFALGLLVLLFVSLVYMVFISVAIWRSANRYEGNKGWAFLAKAVVVLSYVKLLADFADIG